MELAYPWVLIIGAVVIISLFIVNLKPSAFKAGKKIANTDDVSQTPLYKKLLKKFKVYRTIMLSSLMMAIVCTFILGARIITIDTVYPQIHNRDIFLCLDASTTTDELNLQIVDEYKNLVESLDGERFGISIFNARSVLLVPLTTDYDYVLETLDTLKEAFKKSATGTLKRTTDPVLYSYKYDGTLDPTNRGSSYIGDGLSACLYDFPDLENNDRSKIIIFATDNDCNGTPIINLEEAAKLCKKYNVKVYGIAPDVNSTSYSNRSKFEHDQEDFKNAVEITGGKYYLAQNSEVVKEIIAEIEKTQKTDLSIPKTLVTDYPGVPFILLLISLGLYFWTSKRIRL